MRRRSLVAVLAVVLSLAAGRAEAVTVRDVIELSKAGLSDAVLLALIDVDRSVFSIDTDTLKQLKSAGVSDAVIVAMIKSGRETPAPAPMPPVVQEPAPVLEPQPEPDSEPQPVASMPQPVPYPVAVAVPVYIAIPAAAGHHGSASALRADRTRVAAAPVLQPELAPSCRSAQVPNWGFGGTIRQLPPACR